MLFGPKLSNYSVIARNPFPPTRTEAERTEKLRETSLTVLYMYTYVHVIMYIYISGRKTISKT